MAALTGYFDDSQTDGLILTVAGYVGGERHWEVFHEQWQLVLDRYEVPYFHMKEFGDPGGPYKKWLPAKDHQKQIASFLGALARAIGRSQLKAFGSIVRLKDLARFNRDHDLSLQPYSLATYGCMLWLGKQNAKAVISLIFDHTEKVSSKLKKASIYAKSDTYYVGVTDRIQLIPLNKALTFREVPAIQAGDYAAWEIRKHHLNQNEWWELEDRPKDVTEALIHMMEWSEKKFGSQLRSRKSLDALLESAAIEGVLWDYKVLCEAHEARGGVWA